MKNNEIDFELLKEGSLNCIHIYTIAFNNLFVVREQNRLINKYVSDNFVYTVCDNSNNRIKSLIIKTYCRFNKINYVRLPDVTRKKLDPSTSHGTALNWVYQHFIKNKIRYFGFIDHDIFPITKTSIIPKIKIGFWGLPQEREDRWYLWPGFCFFDDEHLGCECCLDFLPARGVDTGGRNYEIIYSKFDKKSLDGLKHEYKQVREGNDIQADYVELIDDWIHTFNASGWKKCRPKNKIIKELLAHY